MSGLWTLSWWLLFGAIATAMYVAIREYDLLRRPDEQDETEDIGR